jgi:hypothetical protein
MPRYYRRLSLRLFLPDMCLRLHVTTRVCLLPLRTYVVVQLFLGMLQCAEGLVGRALRRQLLSCPESVWFDDNDGDDDDEQRECALAPLQHTTCSPPLRCHSGHSLVFGALISCTLRVSYFSNGAVASLTAESGCLRRSPMALPVPLTPGLR